MHIRFWGTRGSIPTPGPRTTKYGGNTSCVEVRTDDGTLIVLDCGSGARELGQYLLSSGPESLRVYLFIGHTHWDHIQGFPFFVPAFLPGTELHIYAPRGFQQNLEDSLAGQMQYSYFPVTLRELRSQLHFTELEEGFFRVGDVLVETQHLNHTNPTIAYRITADGATVAYVTDHEPFWRLAGRSFRHPGDQRHVAFIKEADLVVHDAQYTEEEYPQRLGWGHSTIEYATEVAVAAHARRLALFHHDPSRSDDALERMEEQARTRTTARRSSLEIFAAAEGQEIELSGSRRREGAGISALRHQPIAGSRVLVVSGNELEGSAIAQELHEDSLVVERARDVEAALAEVNAAEPDLVVVDAHLQGGSGMELIDALRRQPSLSDLPVLLLTEEPLPKGGAQHATDFFAKPFSPPMLRTRVRAWLARRQADRRPARAARAAEVAARNGQPTDVLRDIPLFRSLAPDQLDALASHASERTYGPGAAILRQGQLADSVFFVLSGKVRVTELTEDEAQVELVLGNLGESEIFGEIGVLSDQPRTANVTAIEQTRCLVLPQDEFLRVVQTSPQVAMRLLRVLSDRVYLTDRQLAHLVPDPLTGLTSRRAFLDMYPRLAAQARRRQIGVLLLLLDIVDLKSINDRFGYGVGDDVVRAVADALLASARKTDLVARYGGDEFALLLVDAGPNAAGLLLDRVHRSLAAVGAARSLPVDVRCAIGVASSENPPESPDELLLRADRDMQRARKRFPRAAATATAMRPPERRRRRA